MTEKPIWFKRSLKKMRIPRLLFAILISLLCLGAPHSLHAADTHFYIDSETVPPDLLPPPPAEGSKRWSQEINGVIKAQENLSSKEIAILKDEQKVRLEQMTTILGPSFTRAQLPKTFSLLDKVLADTENIVSTDKKFWHTARPYMTNHNVKLYVDPLNESPSYPSGHTTDARVLAEVLGLLVPMKRQDLRARADAIAFHRIEAGVHYPIDIENGKMLAMLITGALLSNDDFQDDLMLAQKELSKDLAH